jgi:hypothetical protein
MAAGYSLPVLSYFAISKQRYAYNGTVSCIPAHAVKVQTVLILQCLVNKNSSMKTIEQKVQIKPGLSNVLSLLS